MLLFGAETTMQSDEVTFVILIACKLSINLSSVRRSQFLFVQPVVVELFHIIGPVDGCPDG
jgi:hypothetical protein